MQNIYHLNTFLNLLFQNPTAAQLGRCQTPGNL